MRSSEFLAMHLEEVANPRVARVPTTRPAGVAKLTCRASLVYDSLNGHKGPLQMVLRA